jgi:hypothetical protein
MVSESMVETDKDAIICFLLGAASKMALLTAPNSVPELPDALEIDLTLPSVFLVAEQLLRSSGAANERSR